jgi:hypothetical protein
VRLEVHLVDTGLSFAEDPSDTVVAVYSPQLSLEVLETEAVSQERLKMTGGKLHFAIHI